MYCYKIRLGESGGIAIVNEPSTLDRIRRLGGTPLLLTARVVDEGDVDDAGMLRPGAWGPLRGD